MAALPPSANGHPKAWAVIVISSPAPPVNGDVSGAIACAAAPPRRARAGRVRKRRAMSCAGASACNPKRATTTSRRGTVLIGERTKSTIGPTSSTSGAINLS